MPKRKVRRGNPGHVRCPFCNADLFSTKNKGEVYHCYHCRHDFYFSGKRPALSVNIHVPRRSA
jgi:ribosomal protein L37AE/L43A